jgi:hypothetical protein
VQGPQPPPPGWQSCVPLPQLPQGRVEFGGSQTVHVASHWQFDSQVRLPPGHVWVSPGVQTPSPWQADGHWQVLSQVIDPQFPQACACPGMHGPWPLQVPQSQLAEQILVPQLPQALGSPG